jgi:anti-sigma B factor antagonist
LSVAKKAVGFATLDNRVERVPMSGGEGGRDNPGGLDDSVFGVDVIDDAGSGIAVVAVRGDADLHTAHELRSAIADAIDGGATWLVVDLAETTFIDSMTLGVLLGAVKRLRPLDGSVSVVCTDANIRRIFEITLLDRVFSLQESREAALVEAEAQGRPARA